MENEVARVAEVIINVEGTDIVTTKERDRQLNAEERFVLKRLREILSKKTKAYDDILSVESIDWKNTKKEVELVNSVIANVKTNSESEDNKLLASAAFQDRKIRKVEKNRIGKDG